VLGLAVVIPYRALLFDGGCIDDSLRWLTSVDVGSKRNCYEFCNKVVYPKKREKTSVGSEEAKSLICISRNGLQVDLEEEFNKGNYHVGGKFRSQKGISIT
jgi:hypothetical protein